MSKMSFTIGSDGNFSVKTEGMPGSSCLKDADELAAALGATLELRELTDEYYLQTSQKEKAYE